MKDSGKQKIKAGLICVAAFIVFTGLVQIVDVKPLGVNGTDIGFASLNLFFHRMIGVHMTLYTITDWAGIIPILIAASFAVLGFTQLIKRRSFLRVDPDILVLGVHYFFVAALYVLFEMYPINYRPILIDGFMEASYPSSTTLLVASVMPTLFEQIRRRCKNRPFKAAVCILTIIFSVFVIVGRLFAGVHWFTDIVGSLLIGVGLFSIYNGFVLVFSKNI